MRPAELHVGPGPAWGPDGRRQDQFWLRGGSLLNHPSRRLLMPVVRDGRPVGRVMMLASGRFEAVVHLDGEPAPRRVVVVNGVEALPGMEVVYPARG